MSLARQAKSASGETATAAADMLALGRRAREAARRLSVATREEKDKALLAMAAALRCNEAAILSANALDVAASRKTNAN